MHPRVHKLIHMFQPKQGGVSHGYTLTRERAMQIAHLLDRYMYEQKPFLQMRYSLGKCAVDLNIPTYQLSAFLNREIGMNYRSFLNHYRVWYCEELFQQGFVLGSDLSGIAQQCGFGNRNSFAASFKKYTGFTPARYQRGWAKLLTSDTGD